MPKLNPLNSGPCQAGNCDRKTRTRGYCLLHYQRLLRTGSVTLDRPNDGPCKVQGCDRPAETAGQCNPHYRRILRTGNPGTPTIPTRTRTIDETCQTCHRPTRTRTIDETCQTCHRPMRPYNAAATEYPGTVCRSSKDECGSCYNARRAGKPPITKFNLITGTPCTGCGHPLRPKGTKLNAHPNTIAHQAGGYCDRCHKLTADGTAAQENLAITRKARLDDRPPHLGPKAASQRNALERYIQNRRSIGIPPEGIPLTNWIHKNQVTA